MRVPADANRPADRRKTVPFAVIIYFMTFRFPSMLRNVFFFSSAVAPESFAFLVGVVQYTETLYSTFDSCIYSISICKTYFSMGC